MASATTMESPSAVESSAAVKATPTKSSVAKPPPPEEPAVVEPSESSESAKSKPGANSNKDAVYKVTRTPVAIGCASIRIVIKVSVWTIQRRSINTIIISGIIIRTVIRPHANGNLRIRASRDHQKQNRDQPNQPDIF